VGAVHLDHDLARRQQGISFNPNVHHNATMPRLLNASMASEDSCGALRQERCRAVHGVRPVAAFAGRLAERGEGGHRRLVSTANVFAHTRDCRTQSRTSSALVEDTMKLKMNLSLLLASASLIGALFAPTVGMANHISGCIDFGPLPDPSNPNKATLCHFTGSDSNPFIINEVSPSAVDAHTSHHGDCFKFFGQPEVCIP